MTDDSIDEDALSFGYVPVEQLHRIRQWITDEYHYLEVLPPGTRAPGTGPEVRHGRPPWAPTVKEAVER